jgi:hypothetical protein
MQTNYMANITAHAVVQSRLGDSENLRLDRQDRSSEGQNGYMHTADRS